MFILLKHFYKEKKTKIMLFDTSEEIENHMNSHIEYHIDEFSKYFGKHISQTKNLNLKLICGYIFNNICDACIYEVNDNKYYNEFYADLKFDINGKEAPFISSFKYKSNYVYNSISKFEKQTKQYYSIYF